MYQHDVWVKTGFDYNSPAKKKKKSLYGEATLLCVQIHYKPRTRKTKHRGRRSITLSHDGVRRQSQASEYHPYRSTVKVDDMKQHK